MKFGNCRHARESAEHRAIKERAADAAMAAGADVRFEFGGCDCIAIKRIGRREFRVGIEVERSTRNVVRNVTRDIKELKCDALLIFTPTSRMKAIIQAHMDKHLSCSLTRNVFVVNADNFSEALFRGVFDFWLGVNLSPACPKILKAQGIHGVIEAKKNSNSVEVLFKPNNEL